MDRRFDVSTVQALLTTRLFRHLVVLARVGSTNDVVKEMARRGAPEGTVVVADEQTAGRGRLERRWLAPPATCLLVSLLFRPDLPLAHASRLTMLTSLAAADAVERVANLRPALKWPNDLVVRSAAPGPGGRGWRKLAGLLTETEVVGERAEVVVVGVGINVNVPVPDLPALDPAATSILAETGREVEREALLATLLAGVEERYAQLRAGQGPYAEWAARLATLGERVEAATSDGVLVGTAEAVDEEGALLLRTSDGIVHRLLAGDVTLAR